MKSYLNQIQAKPKMKKIYWNFLKSTLGILLLVILFNKLGFSNVYKILIDTSITHVFLAVLISISSILLGAFNLKILLHFIKAKISFSDLLKVYSLSWSIGLFLPGRIGDFSIIPLLEKKGLDFGKGAAISFLDKLITFVVLSILTIFAVFIYLPIEQAWIILIVITFVAILTILFFITNKGRKFIRSLFPKNLIEKFSGFSYILFDFLKYGKMYIFLNFLITIFKQVVLALIIYAFLASFNIYLSFIEILLIISAITIISLIPVSVSGLGIKESAAVFLFGLAGLDKIIVAAIFTLLLIARYVIGALLIYFIKLEN